MHGWRSLIFYFVGFIPLLFLQCYSQDPDAQRGEYQNLKPSLVIHLVFPSHYLLHPSLCNERCLLVQSQQSSLDFFNMTACGETGYSIVLAKFFMHERNRFHLFLKPFWRCLVGLGLGVFFFHLCFRGLWILENKCILYVTLICTLASIILLIMWQTCA